MNNEENRSIFELRNPEDRDIRYERAVGMLKKLSSKNYPIEKAVRILNRLGVVDDEQITDIPEKKGKYRKDSEIVYGGEVNYSVGIRSECLPELMPEFGGCIDKLLEDNKNETFELAAFSSLLLGVIHPFYEGSGRTSRLLMNYILVKRGLKAKNLDGELVDGHLDTSHELVDVEIDTARNFGKTIVEFTTLTDLEVERRINDFVMNNYNESGYFPLYPPTAAEVKLQVVKDYMDMSLNGRTKEIVKIKEMSEIIQNLPDNK